jgi:hypothetical protein
MRRHAALATLTLLILAAHCLARTPAASEQRAGDGSKLVGNWTGESLCVGSARPACRDERVVYHIAAPPDETGKVTLRADKIVDGKPEPMGELDLKYDALKGTLIGEFTIHGTHGVWEYTVKGDTMEGTLTILPDKSIVRRVKVQKEP